MEFIDSYNLTGLVIGISTFLIIGLFHPVVIKCEYYFGTRCWWIFLISVFRHHFVFVCPASLVVCLYWGFSAFSSFWTVLEIFEQKGRVKKGWFPMNPKRKKEYES